MATFYTDKARLFARASEFRSEAAELRRLGRRVKSQERARIYTIQAEFAAAEAEELLRLARESN